MSNYSALFKPLRLNGVTFRNRLFGTAHAPAYAEDGAPKERYQRYHLEKARGGVGLAMFGGSSSIAADSPLTFGQINVGGDDVIPWLQQFSERMHGEGAALMIQISHMGMRAHWNDDPWIPLISPSQNREPMHRSWAKEMEDFDLERVIENYAAAALRCKKGGLDGLEINANAHHLFDSFLSPKLNRRQDQYGGSLEARMRFPMEVLGAMREAAGSDFSIGLRLTGDDLVKGGLEEREALDVSVAFGESGLLDFLNVYQGNGDYGSHLRDMIPDMDYDSAPFLYLAAGIKSQVDIPIFHATGIRDFSTAARAIEEGHTDMVGMTRAQIADPHMIAKLLAGREDDIRQCVGANYCIDRVTEGKPMACIQNASTGREELLPHAIAKTDSSKKVVVVGGGPGGLESARTAKEAGHDVVLFERNPSPGGQLALSTSVGWRANMAGITRWLIDQVTKLGVDVRLATEATKERVLAENPDCVIIATGGTPAPLSIEGAEYLTCPWKVLSGEAELKDNVLIFDEIGQQCAVTVADYASERGSLVELITPDQMVGEDVGNTVRKSFLKRLYERNVIMTPSHHLSKAYQEGDSLIAVLREHYSGVEFEREVKQIIHENGTLPRTDLYQTLREHSVNRGELDLAAFFTVQPQTINTNPEGSFQLFRIGDAVMSRNVHAAIFDGARIARSI